MLLTHDQMMAHWRRAHGYEPERADCSVEVFDGVDATPRLALEMRQWYLDLLDNAPVTLLCPHDVAGTEAREVRSGVWALALPAAARRVLSLTVAGSAVPVRVLSHDRDRGTAAWRRLRCLLTNPYAPAPQQPLAIADGSQIMVYCPTRPQVTAIRVINDPGDEVYEFDESALGLLYRTKQ